MSVKNVVWFANVPLLSSIGYLVIAEVKIAEQFEVGLGGTLINLLTSGV